MIFKVIFPVFIFFSLSVSAQNKINVCNVTKVDLQGTRFDSGYFTRTTSLDSIKQMIKEHGGFKSKKEFGAGEYDMIIKGDSLAIYGDENKFEIDVPNCSLHNRLTNKKERGLSSLFIYE
jgi:hypothetical protein